MVFEPSKQLPQWQRNQRVVEIGHEHLEAAVFRQRCRHMVMITIPQKIHNIVHIAPFRPRIELSRSIRLVLFGAEGDLPSVYFSGKSRSEAS